MRALFVLAVLMLPNYSFATILTVNLYDNDSSSFINATENVKQRTEDSGARYWTTYLYTPNASLYHWTSGIIGSVTYAFETDVYIQTATIKANTNVMYGSANSYVNLAVSPNGVDWTAIAGNDTVDVGDALHDSRMVFVRAIMFQPAPVTSAAQFLRSYDDGVPALTFCYDGYDYQAPEPSTIAICWIVAIMVVLRWLHNAKRGTQ